jgi:hypothetical protein
MNPPPSIPPDWKWGTPEGSREFDRMLDRRLTFREKVQWLEEAESLTLRLQSRKTEPPQVPPVSGESEAP